MHSSELPDGNIYKQVLKGIEFLDEGEFLEGIMWFEETAKFILQDVNENKDDPKYADFINDDNDDLLDDINEIREMIHGEDWPGVLEQMEKILSLIHI